MLKALDRITAYLSRAFVLRAIEMLNDEDIRRAIDLLSEVPHEQRQDLWFCLKDHADEFGGFLEQARQIDRNRLTDDRAKELAQILYDKYLKTPTCEKWRLASQARAEQQIAQVAPNSPVKPVQQPQAPAPKPHAPKPVGDPTAAILEFMAANRSEDYTYNQVAQGSGVYWQEASALLKKLVKAKQYVVEELVIDKKTGQPKLDKSGKPVPVYRYAPERWAIHRDRSCTREVVSGVICNVLADNPYLSNMAIRQAVRECVGKIDNGMVDKCLAGLIDDGKILVNKGPRNASIHHLA